MATAKEIRVAPISSGDARRIISTLHYSGSSVQNSVIHLGVFLNGKCGGAMQFGSSMDKRRMLGLVRGTQWNEFMELNRMAFADWLPRNSESRALGFALRWLRKEAPHLKWIVSFSDGTQCGDGTIYRASGFVLTQIKKNTSLLRMPDGQIKTDKTLDNDPFRNAGWWKKRGATPLVGFQLRYVFFLKPDERKNLNCEEVPFSEIERCGAGMYKGIKRDGSAASGTPSDHDGRGGATPTPSLSIQDDNGAT